VNWIDGHLDLAYLAQSGFDLRVSASKGASRCVSLPALREANVGIVFATIYTEPTDQPSDEPWAYPADSTEAAEQAGISQLEIYEKLDAEGEIAIVRSRSDLRRVGPLPKVVLLMEGADPIGTPDDLARWHERGLRAIGLTWALGTRYAGGNARPGSLTSLGVELVCAMNELNMIHDVSHLADEAFDGVLEHARSRIVATHSNCRSLLDGENQRHLRDDQIVRIAEHGGVIGLNLFTKFLTHTERATIDDCTAHLEHICKIAGHRRAVALGSDMDGGFGPAELPIGLDHPSRLLELADALRKRGWSEEEIEGFACRNWLRVLEESLPA
jgi:membrane dipeptidase